MVKNDEKSEDTGVSTDAALATTGQQAVELANGDVAGKMQIRISDEMRDSLTAEFLDALAQIQDGFGELTAPGDIFKQNQPFYVVDAVTIFDYEDRSTGEIKTKHIFRLEFADGVIKSTMQSDARPRRVLATAFTSSRKLGVSLKAGPYLYSQKKIVGQIQPAFIFVPQPGFKVAPAYQF